MTKVAPILALDMATRLGWAARSSSGEITSGWVQLPSKTAQERVVGFAEWLWHSGRLGPISFGRGILTYEQPVLKRKGKATLTSGFRVGCHLEAELLSVSKSFGVGLIQTQTPAEIKKNATGKGNAGKELVTAAMREFWGRPDLEDDNEADALALLKLTIELVEAEEGAIGG